MKKFFVLSVTIFLSTFAIAQEPVKPAASAAAAASGEAPLQMMTYQMVILREVSKPDAKPQTHQEQNAKLVGHLANLARLNRERKAVLYGPFTVPEAGAPSLQGLAGIAIMDVKDAAAAKAEFTADPFVAAGEMAVEVKPWLGPKGWFAPPAQPAGSDPAKMDVEPLVFGVLVAGPATKIQPPVHTDAQRQEIQKGHLAYMGELNKQGKLVAAGPFMEAGDWRGIVIYRVADVKAAQALAAEDPAVKAGRLAIEARSWMTLKGILK